MANKKIEIRIKANGQPDYHCLPAWIAQDILIKIEADQIESRVDTSLTDDTLINEPLPEIIESLS